MIIRKHVSLIKEALTSRARMTEEVSLAGVWLEERQDRLRTLSQTTGPHQEQADTRLQQLQVGNRNRPEYP